MNGILGFAVIMAGLFAFDLWIKSRRVPTFQVRLDQLPKVIEALAATRSSPAFAAFLFKLPGPPGEDVSLNLQFSVENGKVGFDWVLLASRNIRDEAAFVAFAQSLGFEPREERWADGRYLRVHEGDIVGLCRAVITELYGLSEAEPVEMIVQGFVWKV